MRALADYYYFVAAPSFTAGACQRDGIACIVTYDLIVMQSSLHFLEK